jgi:hypothetical protein
MEKDALSARPSPPFRRVSCSPGGRGTRRDHSAGALFPRGILARKWPAMRPVFGKAPKGGPEKVRTEMGWLRKAPSLLPLDRGRTDIIGPGFWIVLSFCPDFLFTPWAMDCRPVRGCGDTRISSKSREDTRGRREASQPRLRRYQDVRRMTSPRFQLQLVLPFWHVRSRAADSADSPQVDAASHRLGGRS